MLGGEIMSQIMEQVAFDYPNFYTEVDASTIEETPTQKKPILDRKKILKSKKAYWVGRRTQDIILSSLALIVLSPFMLLVALIIYIDDPHGSPIFVQERIGRGGKPFKFYKFRSMVVDAEDRLDELQSLNEKDGPAFKIHDDPRITHVGKFIRKTSIDELPQLVNVLKGDMSICGPRPPLPREVEKYNEYQMQRLYVTPGLTCYWQIQHNRDDLSFDEWLELDLKYLRERSFIVDWKIIFATIGAVLGGNGA
jgi:lipopolysaccharide/colanic/teichoic acid biosynthesis glycosyltransferase